MNSRLGVGHLTVTLFIVLWLFGCGIPSKNVTIHSLSEERTTTEQRTVFRQHLVHKTIEEALRIPLTDSTESQWSGAFWGMNLALYRSDRTDSALGYVLSNFEQHSGVVLRAALETAYCLYPAEFTDAIDTIARITEDPKLFAMAITHLNRSFNSPYYREEYTHLLQSRFPEWKENSILYMLEKELHPPDTQRPPIVDLLSHPFEQGKTVIFSFQRKHREYPGLTVVRKPNGTFLRKKTGNFIALPHLALAVSNLPEFLTNGNTPQGIYSIQGTDISDNMFIGRTPNIQMVMPFESSPSIYFHAHYSSDSVWTKAMYRQLLPSSWQNYLPIYGTWYAGKAGRTEIIAHGTTINPEFYSGKPYYPMTPSLGCLTTTELWSSQDGKCLLSDQLTLIHAYRRCKNPQGYFVVVELDDTRGPVTRDEIVDLIAQAERRME